jgi:hypothetical protein
MADCKEIDAALARLSGKIDGLNGRLNGLEARQKECCDNKPQNPSDVDLEALIKRISELEKTVKAISSFLLEGLRPLIKIFHNFFDFLSEN